jgi:hypothetical protein
MWGSLTWAALAFVSAVIINATGQSPWLMLATLVAGLVAAWRFMRCKHPAPHGFIPPTIDRSGNTRSAQWFCRSCGDTWPAEMAYERRAVRARRR